MQIRGQRRPFHELVDEIRLLCEHRPHKLIHLRMNNLLPAFRSDQEYDDCKHAEATYLPAMREICARHAISYNNLTKFEEGESAIVFALVPLHGSISFDTTAYSPPVPETAARSFLPTRLQPLSQSASRSHSHHNNALIDSPGPHCSPVSLPLRSASAPHVAALCAWSPPLRRPLLFEPTSKQSDCLLGRHPSHPREPHLSTSSMRCSQRPPPEFR